MTAKRSASALLFVILALGVASVKADVAPGSELRVMRADYFQNYAGWFLSVEVFDDQVSADGSSGPAVSFAWRTATGSYGSDVDVPRYIDPVTSAAPDVYLYNRTLVRVGAAPPAASPDPPVMIRVTSSSGAEVEVPVRPWLASEPPPHVAGYLRGFVSHYMDPTEVTSRFVSLATDFPNIAEIVNLPEATHGYRRRATTVMGVPAFAPYAGQVGNLNNAAAQQAVILESKTYGDEGGNAIFATFRNPGAANSALSVSLSGNELVITLSTDAVGALSSTALHVVAAINAYPAANAALTASLYRGFDGTGISQATPRSQLSDFLNAPSQVQRGPFQMKMLRIGKHRDGSKVGVFIYCQQQAREWATPITCLESAERLLRNYATDPQTMELVDNLDIFIVPSVNPDGAHYSMYDNNNQQRNLVNYCTFRDPLARHFTGVNLDRNNTVGSLFDGYVGAAGGTNLACAVDVYGGPFELSEAETRNGRWLANTFSNIRFSLNVQSDGGYFMWPPGAYTEARVALPRPGLGLEAYHFAAAEYILSRVKQSRGTAVLPERVGALSDVRSSEAGNSADDQFYASGIIAYTMAIGADRFESMTDGTARNPVGVRPDFIAEGLDEAMEFADGVFGLLEQALAYSRDVSAPSVGIVPDGGISSTPMRATFSPGGEPSVVYYTLDGSTPTIASPTWEAERPRLPGSAFLFTESTTVKWIAIDIKGNVSAVRSAHFLIDATLPAISVTTPSVGATYLLGATIPAAYECTDDTSAVLLCGGSAAIGAPIDTLTAGAHTFVVNAQDAAGNTRQVTVGYEVVTPWPFGGFSGSINEAPAVNDARAGSVVPFRFSLGANRGLQIFEPGYPASAQMACAGGSEGALEPADTPGGNGLRFNNGTYSYSWKTDRSWEGTCRVLVLKFADQSEVRALFRFR